MNFGVYVHTHDTIYPQGVCNSHYTIQCVHSLVATDSSIREALDLDVFE